jgi:predicted Zn-dependent protease
MSTSVLTHSLGVALLCVPLCCAAQTTAPAAAPGVVKQNLAASLSTQSLREFNAEDFLLAYDVLLGAGDLQRAFLVAQRAVQARPTDRQWRRKLAQVSEWTQRPDVAAAQWLALFALGDHSLDTLRAVVRLAPQADQPLLALQAWAELSKRQELTPAQWLDLFNLYELAAEPLQGSQFFESQFSLKKEPKLLEYAARMAENAGDDARAQRLYLQRTTLQPFSLDLTLRAAVLLVRKDKMQEALNLLKAQQDQVPAQAQAYWQLLRQVAWEAGDMTTARASYSEFAGDPSATLGDWSRLIFLVRQTHPAQAAELAIQAYRRFESVDQLLLGLGIYAELMDRSAQRRVYAELQTQPDVLWAKNARFFMMRSQFYQSEKKPDLALADFVRAFRLVPHDAEVVLAGLWLMVDNQRLDLLPDFLRDHAELAAQEPTFWSAYAAANQVLERHGDAVRWYAKAVKHQPDDTLLLLNYADALERSKQVGMADRVRRHAWLQLKKKFPSGQLQQTLPQSSEMLAFARLSLLDQSADSGLALVRQWVGQMAASPDSAASEQTAILILGWALLKEQFHNARLWMWQRYARQAQVAPPLWADSQTALQLQETTTLERLLAEQAQAMPIYNRYDVAYALGHVQQAVDIAFQGMTQQEDEALYDRYRQHVPAQANYVQMAWNSDHLGGVNSQALAFEARVVPHPKLHLRLQLEHSKQSGTEPLLQALTPATDVLSGMEMDWFGAGGTSTMALQRHRELDDLVSLRLQQSYAVDGRLNVDAGLAVKQQSSVSLPMQVAGYENKLFASLNYKLGKREYLRVAPSVSQYFSQWGDDLGSSKVLDVELGYRLRTEYPDWRLRTYLNWQDFSLGDGLSADSLARLPTSFTSALTSQGNARYFIPESSSSLGGCWSMGDNLAGQSLREGYSRGWRPYFDVCVNHNSLNGMGLNGSLGLVGSVMGEDHLLIELRGSDGSQTNTLSSNALVVRYRRYF